jgi:hypothetical protein
MDEYTNVKIKVTFEFNICNVTGEEAIKVLDSIHDFISCDGEMNNCKFRVYQMPQKGELK